MSCTGRAFPVGSTSEDPITTLTRRSPTVKGRTATWGNRTGNSFFVHVILILDYDTCICCLILLEEFWIKWAITQLMRATYMVPMSWMVAPPIGWSLQSIWSPWTITWRISYYGVICEVYFGIKHLFSILNNIWSNRRWTY